MSDTPQSPGLILPQLLADVKIGNSVLFLGSDLPLGYDGAPPSRPELADLLAEQYDLPTGQPWPETVQDYLNLPGSDKS